MNFNEVIYFDKEPLPWRYRMMNGQFAYLCVFLFFCIKRSFHWTFTETSSFISRMEDFTTCLILIKFPPLIFNFETILILYISSIMVSKVNNMTEVISSYFNTFICFEKINLFWVNKSIMLAILLILKFLDVLYIKFISCVILRDISKNVKDVSDK